MVDNIYTDNSGNIWELPQESTDRARILSRSTPLLEQRESKEAPTKPLYDVTPKGLIFGIAVGLVGFVLFALFIQFIEGGI